MLTRHRIVQWQNNYLFFKKKWKKSAKVHRNNYPKLFDINCRYNFLVKSLSYYELLGIPEFLDSACKCWTLECGRWTLNPGVWTLDSGSRTLDSGRWTLDAGLSALDPRRWTWYSGCCTLDSRRWTINARLWILGAARWTLN